MSLVATATALLAAGCGPTELQAGQAVLLMAPLITLAGGILAWSYARAWMPLAEGLRFRVRPTAIAIGLQLLACAGMVATPAVEGDYVLMALCFVGTSYLSFQVVALRLGVVLGLRRHYSWLGLTPWLLLYGPALWLGYTGSPVREVGELPTLLWILPGYSGLVTGPLVLFAALEVALRRRSLALRLRAEALPRPLPEARVR